MSDSTKHEKSLDDVLSAIREADYGGATEMLIELYERQVFGYCLSRLNSHERAEETFQEIFLGVWRGMPEFRGALAENPEKSLLAWMWSIARNQVNKTFGSIYKEKKL